MITYFDTSALVKLLIAEPVSEQTAELWSSADSVATASISRVEGFAALAAATTLGRPSDTEWRKAAHLLDSLMEQMLIVGITEDLVQLACDLAGSEALRGNDAVQLAAALTVEAAVVVSTDLDLCDAASRNGFHVANPSG